MTENDKKEILRGDIFYADLGRNIGSDQCGIRPVMVIQNDVGNKFGPTIIVCPLTSEMKKASMPTHVSIGRKFGLPKESMALLEQIRVIDRARLGKYIGTVDQTLMVHINDAISISLGLK